MNDTDSTSTPDPTFDADARGAAVPPVRRTGWVMLGVAAAGLAVGVLGTMTITSAVAAEPVAVVVADSPGRFPIPSELREDVRELIQAAPEDRPDMFRQILAQAEAGDYGMRARLIADRIADRIDALPAELTADIAEVQAAPAEDRPELRQQIRENAEAGVYGADIQARLAELEQALEDGGIRAVVAELLQSA